MENVRKAIPPDDRARVVSSVDAGPNSPSERYSVEYRVIRKDGTVSWLATRGNVAPDKPGEARRSPDFVIDIAQPKSSAEKTEELHSRLEQQAALLHVTLSSITDFVYVFDRNGRFAFVNQALLNLWGLKLEDAVGKDFLELKYPEELAARLQRQIQQVFDSGEGVVDETPYTSPTGAGGYYEYIFHPVFSRDGKVEVVVGSTRDITERKRLEEQLRHSEERSRILAETLENQVKVRTAELEDRNSEILKKTEVLSKLSISLMEMQDREGRRIARELHDSAGQITVVLLLNLARMVEELKGYSPALVELAETTQAYARELDQEIRTTSYLFHPPLLEEIGLQAALHWYTEGLQQRGGLEVQLEIPDDFQRPSREMEITIFRVVQACLTNVHRHSGSKSAHINLRREGTNVVLEVCDKGRGIDAGKLDKMREKSVGVGLQGIRERVRAFGGEVRIDSKVGVGTTIWVTLPVKAE